MQTSFAPNCLKKLQKIKKTNTKTFQKIHKQLLVFQKTPNHPSLRLHKLSGDQQECWSISIDTSHSILFYYAQIQGETTVIFFSLGTHD